MDFDDILLRCRELLQSAGVRERWQRIYRYILVDEAQDCSIVQYETLRLLAGQERNIMFVGDDDQSLYGFRGASPEWMFRFQTHFPDGRVLYLSRNFRSCSEIVTAAARLIRQNRKRCAKEHIPVNREHGIIRYGQYENEAQQYRAIAEELFENGRKRETTDCAVLVRTNAQLPPLLAALQRAGVSYRVPEKAANPYGHWSVEDILDYCRAALGKATAEDWLRLLNRPDRHVPRDVVTGAALEAIADGKNGAEVVSEMMKLPDLSGTCVRELKRLQRDMALLVRLRPYAAVQYIRKGMFYDTGYVSVCARRNLQDESQIFRLLDNVQETAQNDGTLLEWIGETARNRTVWDRNVGTGNNAGADTFPREKTEAAVQVMTYHASKGLEFERVYLPDVNETITPYGRATEESELEEERRMFYVAVTRAKRYLSLSSVRRRGQRQMEVSRFAAELQGMQANGENSGRVIKAEKQKRGSVRSFQE